MGQATLTPYTLGNIGSAAGSLATPFCRHTIGVSGGATGRPQRLHHHGESPTAQIQRPEAAPEDSTAHGKELLSTGQAKYDELVSAGKAQHDALVAGTEALVAEAQQRRAPLLQELGRERSVLQKEIEGLRTFKRNHRAHLKSYLKGQLIELEQTSADETS